MEISSRGLGQERHYCCERLTLDDLNGPPCVQIDARNVGFPDDHHRYAKLRKVLQQADQERRHGQDSKILGSQDPRENNDA